MPPDRRTVMVTKYSEDSFPYRGPPFTETEEAEIYASWSGPTHAIARSKVAATPAAEPKTPRS
jgi:hypothetical protein